MFEYATLQEMLQSIVEWNDCQKSLNVSNNITKGCTYLILCNKHEHGSAQVQNTDDFSNSVIKKSVFLILEGKTNTNISNLEGNIF